MSPDVKKLKLDTPYYDGRPIEPASEPELLKFEKMLGYSLPGDFREFLKQINGGVPCCNPPPKFRANNGSHFRLSLLLNFGIKNKVALLTVSWKGLRPAIPHFLLPFGDVGANDAVAVRCDSPEKHPDYFGLFLGLSEPVRGQVFLEPVS